jgi:alpha-N-arabinofuranosidase
MLEDRKFYYSVSSKAPAGPQNGMRAPVRRWSPVGPDESVVMDKEHPYAGDHVPLVKLDGDEARGLQQDGLVVHKGRLYAGRVVLAGDPGAKVSVSLIWGANANDRQSIAIGKLRTRYATFPLKFKAAADSDSAQLEIAGAGAGTFRVGAISLMPADNLQGFRPEVIAALKQLRSGVYRFPGGNFVSAHEWRNAVGDPDKRPAILDPVWNTLQPNDVGIDEFMALCRLLDVEPYITVNAGFGDAWSAAQYVEYANGAVATPMGRLRAANGHPQPYGIKFWGIGNEMFGIWQFGVMPPEQYQIKHNLFAKAMRKVDPSIKILASGAMPDHMTGSRLVKMYSGKVVPDYLDPWDWSGGMLTHCLDNMDILSEHYYAYSEQRFDFEKGERVRVPNQPLLEWARQPASYVRAKYEHYQEYLARIPALKEKPVPISISEWAYTGASANSHKVVLAYAWAFHEMFRHSELFRMATFTFATSLLSTTRTEAVLNPSGLLFKLYRDHFGSVPVAVDGSSPQPAPIYPGRGNQPKVNPGSDTYPLDVAAALSEDGKTLSVAVVNPTESEHPLRFSFRGAKLSGKGNLWRMAPASLNASIVVGRKPEVEVKQRAVTAVPGAETIPPFSVSIYELTVR